MINPRLNPDGSEILDLTPISVDLRVGYLSADMKLKQMLQRELEKDREPDETNLDDYDFELPDDTPQIHPSVQKNPQSKREILNVIKESKQKQKQSEKELDESEDLVSKQPKGASPKHNEKNTSKSANKVPTEGADENEVEE